MLPIEKWRQEAFDILEDQTAHESLRRLAWRVLKDQHPQDKRDLLFYSESRDLFKEGINENPLL